MSMPSIIVSPISLLSILIVVKSEGIVSKRIILSFVGLPSASNTASYELTFDTAALPLEYVAYLLGHKCENGVMTANKDDVAPYFAVMFQSDKRNGNRRLMKFLKCQFAEPDVKGSTKEANISYQTPTLTAKAIYRLSDGNSYTYADTESAGFTAETAAGWYESV